MSTPGEDDPPPRFDRLPDNFETQRQLLLQGKPALQRNFSAAVDFTAGLLPKSGPGFEQGWTGLLDTYALVTGLVDDQIGRIMSALESRPEIAANTIVIFTADHGEYAGAHGLRNKGGAVYEEAIRVPLYIKDPIRPLARGAGTTRAQMTSSVDLVPLLMTLGSGDDAWRRDRRYAHLARRIDIDAILSNPNVRGLRYILHATDEDFLEEGPRTGKFAGAIFGLGAPNHVIGLRTAREKLGVNSFWAPNSIEILRDGQEFEAYDYTSSDGTQELINVAPSNPDRSLRNRGLFTSSYNFLFRQAVRHELRRPLPSYLRATQQEAINDYLAYKQAVTQG